MQVKAFHDPATHTMTYVVFDARTGDAIVIDPVLDFDPLTAQSQTRSVEEVVRFARNHGLRVRYVVETHAHADHLSAGFVIKSELGARLAIGERITEVQRAFKGELSLGDEFRVDGGQFDKLLRDGEILAAGSLRARVLATPGHTPTCISLRIEDAVFTGDALFVEDFGTGRCDFPCGSASSLYDSVHERLYSLPEATRVFVGHDYQPGGRALRYETTIGESKRSNVHLRHDTTREAYVRLRAERDATLPPPRLLRESLPINLNGGLVPPRAA